MIPPEGVEVLKDRQASLGRVCVCLEVIVGEVVSAPAGDLSTSLLRLLQPCMSRWCVGDKCASPSASSPVTPVCDVTSGY